MKNHIFEQAEVIRFEDEVIQGGPVVLPGTLNLLEQVSIVPPYSQASIFVFQ